MKAEGRESGEYKGFEKPVDGWHLIQFGEGIEFLKDKDGATWKHEKTGANAYKFPAMVVDDTDASNGLDCSQIIMVNDFGEQRVADILASVGLYKKFAEKFPGDDVSMFSEPVMNAIKTKVPGTFMKVRLETNKKDFQNVVEFAKADAKVEDKKKDTGKGKKDKTTEVKAPAASGDGW